MHKLRLTAAARSDLQDIQDRGLEQFGLEAVRRHMQGFERIFALLRTHAQAGAARPDYGDGIRVFSHRPHRLIYHASDQGVLILRVLHSAMDEASALGARR